MIHKYQLGSKKIDFKVGDKVFRVFNTPMKSSYATGPHHLVKRISENVWEMTPEPTDTRTQNIRAPELQLRLVPIANDLRRGLFRSPPRVD